jgi:hypothetical protein
MNPISLLTKGRTIGGLKERPGRYKLLGNSVLPNFSGPKNPFPTTTHPMPEKAQSGHFDQPRKAAEPQKEEASSGLVKSSPFAKAAVGKLSEKRKQKDPELPKSPGVVRVQDQTPKPRLWSHLAVIPSGWMDKWMPRRKAQPFTRATIQPELALEKVKVMRNDLSEDDLEVVTIAKKTGNKVGKPAQSEKVEREKLTAIP